MVCARIVGLHTRRNCCPQLRQRADGQRKVLFRRLHQSCGRLESHSEPCLQEARHTTNREVGDAVPIERLDNSRQVEGRSDEPSPTELKAAASAESPRNRRTDRQQSQAAKSDQRKQSPRPRQGRHPPTPRRPDRPRPHHTPRRHDQTLRHAPFSGDELVIADKTITLEDAHLPLRGRHTSNRSGFAGGLVALGKSAGCDGGE